MPSVVVVAKGLACRRSQFYFLSKPKCNTILNCRQVYNSVCYVETLHFARAFHKG